MDHYIKKILDTILLAKYNWLLIILTLFITSVAFLPSGEINIEVIMTIEIFVVWVSVTCIKPIKSEDNNTYVTIRLALFNLLLSFVVLVLVKAPNTQNLDIILTPFSVFFFLLMIKQIYVNAK